MSCNEEQVIPMKTGDTVRLTGIYKDSNDVPKSLDGYRIDIDFIHPTRGRVIQSTNSEDEEGGIVIWENGNMNIGEYTVYGGSSEDWPEGKMPVDVLYSKNGDQIHTEDFFLDFTKGRSRINDGR